MNQTFHKALRRLGSAETTSALIALGGATALAGIFFPIRTSDWMMPVGVLLVANLVAALATNTKLKSQPMLFALHAALIALIAAIGLDRMTSMSGRVEVTEGAMFEASNVKADAGLLHRLLLDKVKFLQGPFEITYAPGMKRRETESIIRIPQQNGAWREVRVGDDTPLTFGDYRFYTTHNKGFAPILTYVNAAGAAQTGSIHMPSYPSNESMQGISWTPPGASRPLKIWLHIPEPVFEKDKAWKFAKPANTHLVLMDGEKRQELRVGEIVTLASGQLRYDGLRSWMGYTIVGQSLTHWIAAAGFIAALVLLGYALSVLVKGSEEAALQREQGG